MAASQRAVIMIVRPNQPDQHLLDLHQRLKQRSFYQCHILCCIKWPAATKSYYEVGVLSLAP
ncbi:hypothetical protein ACUOHR_26850, partial [Escherichia coli]